jgi:hypothetical protein
MSVLKSPEHRKLGGKNFDEMACKAGENLSAAEFKVEDARFQGKGLEQTMERLRGEATEADHRMKKAEHESERAAAAGAGHSSTFHLNLSRFVSLNSV